jgi:hypothetical protein
MGLNSKEQNLIVRQYKFVLCIITDLRQGMFGNLGMYGTGIPTGMMVDRYGPRSGGIFGCLTVAIGYMVIYEGKEIQDIARSGN